MDKVILKAEKRQAGGSSSAKVLRSEGFVPSVVYGTKGNEVISVKTHDVEYILNHHKSFGNFVVSLEFEDKKENRLTMIQEIQQHPLTGGLLNIDFKEVSMEEKVESMVSVVPKGDCEGIKLGGVLEQHMWDIKIKCLPMDMPEEYRVDITNLQIGQIIHVSDLPVQGSIEILETSTEIVLAIIAPRTDSDSDEENTEGPTEPIVSTEAKVD